MLHKKSTWIIGAIIALIILGGGYYFYSSATAVAKTETETNEIQTSTVRQGDLTVSATGAGTIIPASEIALSFSTGGTLTGLNVQVGEKVLAGDVLAQLDDTNAQQDLANAELQLAQMIMQTDGSATTTGISFNEIAVEQAGLNLAQAQADLDDLLAWEPDADEIAQAEANLQAAQASYNAARGQEAATYTNVTVSNINLEQAERDLVDAQAVYDTAFDPGREWEFGVPRMADALENEREAATNSLQRAQDDLAIAQANYSSSVSSSNSSNSISAQSNILSAELALKAAQSGPTDEEISTAETAVHLAELAYQQALLNQEAAMLDLQQVQLNLEAAQEAVAAMTLTSPMDGIILTIDANVGETVSTTPIITLADLNQPIIEVYLDETDLDKVGLGYEVDVTFDALPDETFTGTVIQVDPQLQTVSNVTAVRALVELEYNKPQPLPVGLNANIDVIGGRVTNAMLVPVEALREISPGQYAVFVMNGDEPELTFVEVGLMDYTFAEIVSGVEVGDIVTTGIIETQ